MIKHFVENVGRFVLNHPKRDAYKHALICEIPCACKRRIWIFMFTSTYVHIIFLPLVFLLMPPPLLQRPVLCCWFCCLAIRFLVTFYVSFVIFAHISAGFITKHSLQFLYLSLALRFRRARAHFAHSLENWVQHDLFMIHKFVILWLQHSTDMIIFFSSLCFCVPYSCLLAIKATFDVPFFSITKVGLIFTWWENENQIK